MLIATGNVFGFGSNLPTAWAVDAGECSDASGTMTCNLQGQSLNFSNLGGTVLDTLNETATVADVYRFDYNSDGDFTDEGDVRVDALMTVTATSGGSMKVSGTNLSASISTGDDITVRVDFSTGGQSVILQNLEVSTSDLDPGGQLERVRYSGIRSFTLRDGTGIRVSPSTAPSPETGSRTFLGGNRPGGSDGDTVAVVFQPVSSIGLNPFTDGTGGGIGFAFGAANWGGSAVTTTSLGDAEYTITYDSNGADGSPSPPAATTGTGAQTLSTGGSLQKTVSGQLIPISSWNTLANGTGVKLALGGSYRPISDITLYAQYETSTVTFKKNGGTSEPDTTQTGAGLIALDPNPFSRDGWVFDSWNTNAAGDGLRVVDGGTFSFGADDILYAQWTPIYTITYDDNGATSGSVPSATTGAGELTVASNTGSLVRAGADFGSWNTAADGSGTTINAGAGYTPSGNVTLYAQYPETLDVPGSAVDAYTVGFSTIGSVSGLPAIEIKGYTGSVRVVISTSDSSGELRLPSSVTSNLTRVAGYDNSSSITASGDRIGFEASQADANTALAALQYESSGSSAKTDTITVEVTNSGVPELQIGGYYHYYEYVDTLDGGGATMTWDQAYTDSAVQREVGGQAVTGWMATVGSEGENAWITQYVNADAWLGATDVAVEGTWKWVSGSDSLANQTFWSGTSSGSVQNGLYANWASGEPNNAGSREDCAQFYSRNIETVSEVVAGETLTRSAYWNDLPCSGTSLSGYIWEYRSNVSLTTSVNDTFSVSVTTPDAPGRPTGVVVLGGYKSAQVTWSAPTTTGTYPISDYKVEYTTDPSGSWSTFSDGTSTATSATVTGLSAGQTYYFRVTAFNAVFGNSSDVSEAVTLIEPTPRNVSATAGNQQVTVSWQAPSVGTVSSYSVSQSPGSGSCTTATTTCTFTGLTNGTAFSFVVTATMADSATFSAVAVSSTPAAPQSSSGTSRRPVQPDTPPVIVQPPRTPLPTTTSAPQQNLPVVTEGPVLRTGEVPAPPRAPSVLLGGRPTTVSTTVPTTTQLDVRAGGVNLGVKVLEDQGQISQADDGTTEIAVRKGAAASISGSGFRPGATVQVFMPLQGDNAKELTRIPVQPDGSFDGSAPFATRPGDAPLPIGKNVLQLVSLDNDGNQVVVEMAVNIAQGAPAPEQNRVEGVIPAMAPGQSVATSGGEPVPVRITPVSDQKLAVVEGDGWSMAVNVVAEDGGVEPSEGGALLKLVRNESVVVSGGGFMAGTRADVWLFSDPTLLGTVTIDENGEFTGELNVDPNMIPVGEHTLQLQGVGEDGYVKAANLGVLVEDPAEAAPPTAIEQGLGLIWWIIAALVLLAAMVVLIASRRRRDA